MRLLRLTLPTSAENLALDEALLDWAEEENAVWEFLRLWESPRPMVVVGRSSRVHEEVYELACDEANAPILRRSSGGAAIVAGPGCLMYAVILSYALRPELKDIGRAHRFVLGRLAAALGAYGVPVAHAGTSDLVIADSHLEVPKSAIRNQKTEIARKFSGNSMRAKRTHLLYHGTLMYDFDLSQIGRLLRMPPRQPEYRARREHGDFLTNLPLERRHIVDAVANAWPADSTLNDWPRDRVERLLADRFERDEWNLEFR